MMIVSHPRMLIFVRPLEYLRAPFQLHAMLI